MTLPVWLPDARNFPDSSHGDWYSVHRAEMLQIFIFLWDCVKFLKISEDLKTFYNILIFKVVIVWKIFLFWSGVSNDCNTMNFCQWLYVKVCAPIHVICHFHTFMKPKDPFFFKFLRTASLNSLSGYYMVRDNICYSFRR